MSSASGALKRAVQLFDIFSKTHRFNSVVSTFKILDATAETIRAEYTVLEEHCNEYDTLHGGYTATAFDFLTTMCLVNNEADPRPGVSLNLSVNYLKALKLGEKVTFEGEVVRRGRSVAYTTASLFNEKGDIAAHGTHIKHLGN